jgi:hypothetical protein
MQMLSRANPPVVSSARAQKIFHEAAKCIKPRGDANSGQKRLNAQFEWIRRVIQGTWEMITATIIPAAPGVELLHFLAGHLTECLRQGTWMLYAKSGTARTPALSPQP